MPQAQTVPSNDDLVQPEFDVRTGEPKKPQGIKSNSISTSKQSTVINASDIKVSKGKWLKDKLNSLYEDPKFKTASPEQQKQYRSLAYDKWIAPYYKSVLKDEPPTKEQWLTKDFSTYQQGTIAKDAPIKDAYKKVGSEIGLHTLKATSDISSGIAHDLSYVGRMMDSFFEVDKDLKPGERNVEQVLSDVSGYMYKKSEYYAGRLENIHGSLPGEKPKFSKDVPGRLAELGTGAVFFEATGGAKVAKVLNVANPKTAALAYQMAKASWNGAVDYGMWSASQGDSPKEIADSFATGGVLGPAAKLVQRRGLDPLFEAFKSLFKWGDKTTSTQVIEQIIEKASTKSGETTPTTLQSLVRDKKLSPEGDKLIGAAAIKLDEMSQAKFKKPYSELAYIQKIHILNKASTTLADAMQTAKSEGMPKQLVQAQAKEQDELIASIFPEAKASQEKVDKFVQQHGEPVVQTKLLASLPHHNTTIDSSWKHLQARVSFLKSQRNRAKGLAEVQVINDALNEEYNLMKQKAAKEKNLSKGTVGGASANDPQVFKGDEYAVTPNVDPYKHGFTEWYDDSFAKGVAQSAKQQALVKGQKQSFLANAIDNSFLVGSNISVMTRKGEGITKQLFHPQFGLVGGINYEVKIVNTLVEQGATSSTEKMLYINQLGMRPNVVARVWPVKGGGQALFLNAAMEADRQNIGMALIPYNESKSFYEKLGMKEVGDTMMLDKEGVKNLLRSKGLMMMLLGAGIAYSSNKILSEGDFSVKGSN